MNAAQLDALIRPFQDQIKVANKAGNLTAHILIGAFHHHRNVPKCKNTIKRIVELFDALKTDGTLTTEA